MTAHPIEPPVPRGPLLAAGALILFTVLAAGWVRLSGQPIRAPDAPATAQRLLKFEDRPDGGVDVIDAGNGRVFERIEGQAGFVRGTLRGWCANASARAWGPSSRSR
jgi:hypothetical protein